MLIYFSMIIPVVTAFVLYGFWKHRCAWWEFAVPFIVSAILCLIFKSLIEKVQATDTEWWTGAVHVAEYYEDWDEEVACRHPKYKTVTKTRTNSKGQTETYTEQEQDGYEHAYDVDYHAPYWHVIDTNGITVTISSGFFEELSKRFHSRQFVNLHRHYHSKDGNKYVATWPGDEETCEVVTTSHRYENRIKAGHSVFRFPDVEDKTGLFSYPKTHNFGMPFILGEVPDQAKADRKVALWNAFHGREKQCRLLFCVFKDQPLQVGLDQESVWQGGNKNEFVVLVGIDNEFKITWCHVASWTENEILKAEVKDHIREMGKLDVVKLMEWLGPKLQQSFERKHFKDFSYLTIDPPVWTVVLTYVLTILVNVGLSVWIVTNEIDE